MRIAEARATFTAIACGSQKILTATGGVTALAVSIALMGFWVEGVRESAGVGVLGIAGEAGEEELGIFAALCGPRKATERRIPPAVNVCALALFEIILSNLVSIELHHWPTYLPKE